jgi:hypothetical protein
MGIWYPGSVSVIRTIANGFTDLRAKAEERAAFRRDLFAAVEDGRLTEEEMASLERERDEYGLTEDDIKGIRIQLYRRAAEAVASDRAVTEQEWAELEKIQAFLGVADAEVAPTKRELLRLHILHEVKRGNLPVIEVPHLALQKGESAHWSERVTYATKDEKSRAGELIVTSKRLIFRSPRESLSIRLPAILHVKSLEDGVRIGESGKDPKVFRTERAGYVRILQAVLARAMERHGAEN